MNWPLVTVGSGLCHLAAAVRTPAVDVFGIISAPVLVQGLPVGQKGMSSHDRHVF